MILNRLKYALTAVLTGSSTALATKPDVYDYVIIGSGPGGGSLAARTAAETPGHSWQFFVNHYEDFDAARRDPKYTYIQTNGSYYIGLDPPEGARP
ncbi:hypothetical protein LB503_000158 [Fusarium chuoi]|nr:hypothetical protein LB503_000158 [Fusarium chuoi]